MYSRYEYDGYIFNDKSSYNSFIIANDPENCTGWGGPNPENYGGYKEEDIDKSQYIDTSSYQSSYYKRYPSDKKYYHDKREEFDILYETEKAYLLLDNNDNEFWCPKSLMIDTIRIKNVISTRVWKGVARDKVNLI